MDAATLLHPVRALLAEHGFDLVDLTVGGAKSAPLIRVRIDRPGGGAPGAGIGPEECAAASRLLEPWLEERGLAGARYTLEVSSPGLERPLRFPEHWRRFVGERVRVRLAGERGRPEAELVAVPDDAHVQLRLGGVDRLVPLADVTEATLVVDWERYRKGRGS
ncbi:MAG: hypothetical protein NW201_07550 [Gemmatimonadales bacterium]|nr:hypothetical protein [Gemmatimonadales bacterium]